MRSRAVRLASAGFVLVLLLLGLDLVSLVRSEDARHRVDHAAEVRAQAGRSLRLLTDAETGQRGFLLTGAVEYLEPYDRARTEVPVTMQGLEMLVADDPPQSAQVRQLDGLAMAKLQELGETVGLEKAGDHERAVSIVRMGEGKHTMDSARAIVARIQGAEDEILSRNNASATLHDYLDVIVTALAGAALAAVGLLLYAAGRQLGRQLVEARMADLEHFAGRVAHDVRSPLAAVAHALDLARRHPDDPKTGPALDTAVTTLSRVGALVDALLVFAWAGAPPAEGAEANVRAVVEDVVETLGTEAQQSGVELEIEPLPTTTVACSPGVLTSMAANLVENAIEHMGPRIVKRVTISATTDGASTRVEVRDTGPGIPRKQRDTFFDPHLRPPGAAPSGLGLGLATVRRLALAHGGSVGIAANVPAGTVVWFQLPNVARPQPESTGAARRARPWSRLRWRALVRRESHG